MLILSQTNLLINLTFAVGVTASGFLPGMDQKILLGPNSFSFFLFFFLLSTPPPSPTRRKCSAQRKHKDNMIAIDVITDETFYAEVLNLNVLFSEGLHRCTRVCSFLKCRFSETRFKGRNAD